VHPIFRDAPPVRGCVRYFMTDDEKAGSIIILNIISGLTPEIRQYRALRRSIGNHMMMHQQHPEVFRRE